MCGAPSATTDPSLAALALLVMTSLQSKIFNLESFLWKPPSLNLYPHSLA